MTHSALARSAAFASLPLSFCAVLGACLGTSSSPPAESSPDASLGEDGGVDVTVASGEGGGAADAAAAEDTTATPLPEASLEASSPVDAGSDGAADAAPEVVRVYVPAAGSGQLLAYVTLDGGWLGPQVSGSPFASGGSSATSITGDTAGTHVYVGTSLSSGAAEIASFTLDSAGHVRGTQSGSPFSTGVTAAPTRVTLNPAGTRLYAVHQGAAGGSIAVFAVDGSGNVGALRAGSPFGTGSGTYAASVNPAGTRLYVTSQEKSGVFVFTLDASGDVGALVSATPYLTGSSDAPLLSVVHPSGSRLYVTDQNSSLVVYTLDASGDISGLDKGSPFSTPGSVGIAMNAAGTRLYVGTNASTLSVFTLDAVTGAVVGAAASFTVGVGTYDLMVDVSQRDLYVVDYNGSRIAAVTLDANGDPQTAVPGEVPDGSMYPAGVFVR